MKPLMLRNLVLTAMAFKMFAVFHSKKSILHQFLTHTHTHTHAHTHTHTDTVLYEFKVSLFVLTWVPPKVDLKIRVHVQMVYLGDDARKDQQGSGEVTRERKKDV